MTKETTFWLGEYFRHEFKQADLVRYFALIYSNEAT